MSLMYEAVGPLVQVYESLNRYDDDVFDRLNHKYSTIVFATLCLVTIASQLFVGEIIKCWAPAQFPDSWVEYTNSICWSSNTYFIPMSVNNILDAPRKEIVYYQWVPLVLLVQSVLFYLPCVFWIVMNKSVGLDIGKIVKSCHDAEIIDPSKRDQTTEYLVRHIDRSLQYSRPIDNNRCERFKDKLASVGCYCGKRQGNFLIAMYVITKLLYVANVVAQLAMMNGFLGTEYYFYGLEALQDVARTGEYKESLRFPRVALCDFQVRALGRHVPYTIQCTLPINLFNEKIFIFVWFWLALMAVFNVTSTVYWLWVLFTTNRRNFVRRYLKVFRKYNKRVKGDLNAFCDKYLRSDGHFLLQLISKNTNQVITGEIVDALWENFCENYQIHKVDKKRTSLIPIPP